MEGTQLEWCMLFMMFVMTAQELFHPGIFMNFSYLRTSIV